MSDLKDEFEKAVAFIKSGEGTYKPSQSEQLRFYALFKQASQGDVSGKKPGMLDPVGRAKYNAWSDVKGMSHDEAMQAYVKEFNERMG